MVDKNSVFVLGAHYNGLKVIQIMGRKGVPVYAVDTHRSIGTYSRYAEYLRSPDPHYQEKRFVNWLLNESKKNKKKPFVIPTNDGWASALSKHKNVLQDYCIPCVPAWETTNLVLNKRKFYQWASENNYPVPRMYNLEETIKRPDIEFPIIAKPNYRRISSDSSENLKIMANMDLNRAVILKNYGELEAFCETNKDFLFNIIFQDYVPGNSDTMYTVGLYANQNYDVTSVFTGHKVRGYPIDHGDCMIGETWEMDIATVKETQSLIKDLKFNGIAEVEYKKHSGTGDLKLIEVNPRTWSWIGIVEACGVNIPWIAYCDMVMNKTSAWCYPQKRNGEVKFIRLLDDFMNCLYENRKSGYEAYDFSFMDWLHDIKARKRVYAEFSKDDLYPGVISLKIFLNNLFSRIFLKFRKTIGLK